MNSSTSLKKKLVMNTIRVLNFTPAFMAQLNKDESLRVMKSLTEINDKHNLIKISRNFHNIFSYFRVHMSLMKEATPDFTHEVFIELLKQFGRSDVESKEKLQFLEVLLIETFYLNMLLHSRFYIDLFFIGLLTINKELGRNRIFESLENKEVLKSVKIANLPNLVYLAKLLSRSTPVILDFRGLELDRHLKSIIGFDDIKRLLSFANMMVLCGNVELILCVNDRNLIKAELQKLLSESLNDNPNNPLKTIRTSVVLKNLTLDGEYCKALSSNFKQNITVHNYLEGFAFSFIGLNEGSKVPKYIVNRINDLIDYELLIPVIDFEWLNSQGIILSNFYVIDLGFLLGLSTSMIKAYPNMISSSENDFLLRSLFSFKNSIWDSSQSNQLTYELIDALIDFLRTKSNPTIEHLNQKIRGFDLQFN